MKSRHSSGRQALSIPFRKRTSWSSLSSFPIGGRGPTPWRSVAIGPLFFGGLVTPSKTSSTSIPSILLGELSQAFMLMRSWGAIDPTSSGSNQKDGTQLIEEYGRLGLNLVATDHAVEAGIQAISQRLSSGRLKVFRTLSAWLSEFRRHSRDDKGQENTLLMDCTRHLVLTGMKHADIDHHPYDEY